MPPKPQAELKVVKRAVPHMDSSHIVSILHGQHTNDVFISECKDGPSAGTSHARMDVWTMTRSWSRLCFTGYEIKVSRADFKQDNKWHSYLPLCNQLYFVCPKGLIAPEEVPDGVGLKYCTMGRAMTVKKASHRDVQPPLELFCYILMARATVVDPYFHQPLTPEKKLDQWRVWLAEREEGKELGYLIRSKVARHIDDVQRSNQHIKAENERLQEIKRLAQAAGIDRWDNQERMDAKLREFAGQFSPDDISKARELHRSLGDVLQRIDPLKQPQSPSQGT